VIPMRVRISNWLGPKRQSPSIGSANSAPADPVHKEYLCRFPDGGNFVPRRVALRESSYIVYAEQGREKVAERGFPVRMGFAQSLCPEAGNQRRLRTPTECIRIYPHAKTSPIVMLYSLDRLHASIYGINKKTKKNIASTYEGAIILV